jgi:hypothetical protein
MLAYCKDPRLCSTLSGRHPRAQGGIPILQQVVDHCGCGEASGATLPAPHRFLQGCSLANAQPASTRPAVLLGKQTELVSRVISHTRWLVDGVRSNRIPAVQRLWAYLRSFTYAL